MREFWMRLMSAVVIVGLILGYNSVLEARAKDEEIAKLNAKIENVESLEDQESKNGSYKDGTYTGDSGCAKCRSRYDQWCDVQFYRN